MNFDSNADSCLPISKSSRVSLGNGLIRQLATVCQQLTGMFDLISSVIARDYFLWQEIMKMLLSKILAPTSHINNLEKVVHAILSLLKIIIFKESNFGF